MIPFPKSYSLYSLLLISISALVLFFSFRFYAEKGGVIKWDTTLYYAYLPATFIYHDLRFSDKSTEIYNDHQFFLNTDEKGQEVMKMTSGVSMLIAPFFLLAHLYASLGNSFKPDAFSLPYQVAVAFSCLLYSLLGLYFLRKTLLRFFGERATAFTLAALFFGTNLLYYSLKEPMAHAYNFFLLSALFFVFFKTLDKPVRKRFALLGFLGGLLVLSRPTNIIALFVPLLLFFFHKPPLLRRNLPSIFLMLLCAFLVIFPQMLYWHEVTGSWIFYSYTDQGFYFLEPEIINGLFSYRKGWFLYSPIVVLGFAGFFFFPRKYLSLAIFSFFTLLLALWVTFSWWCWWYGGGFSARALIDFLPVLAFGMAGFFQAVLRLKWWFQLPVYLIGLFCCFLSAFYSYQYHLGLLHYDGMTKELFERQFLKLHYIDNYDKYIDPPDYDPAQKSENDR